MLVRFSKGTNMQEYAREKKRKKILASYIRLFKKCFRILQQVSYCRSQSLDTSVVCNILKFAREQNMNNVLCDWKKYTKRTKNAKGDPEKISYQNYMRRWTFYISTKIVKTLILVDDLRVLKWKLYFWFWNLLEYYKFPRNL